MRHSLRAACCVALSTFPSTTIIAAERTRPVPPVEAGDSAEVDWGTVLNLSGKQRMLTQKMSKEILLVGLGIEAQANLGHLKATAGLFDRTLSGLRKGDDGLGLSGTESRRILKQLSKVDEIWGDFQPVVAEIIESGTVTGKQIEVVATKNLPLLREMNKCVKLYEKDAAKSGLKSDPDLAVTINLAGKQRMLTQKLAKELLLMAFGHEVGDNKLNAIETSTLFDRTLKGLTAGDEVLGLPGTGDKAILAQLEKVSKLWATFAPVVGRATTSAAGKLSAADAAVVARVNLALLKEMNKAVGMFSAATK